jgi:hypothetical protein
MDNFSNIPQEVIEQLSQSIRLFSQGESLEALTLFSQIEPPLQSHFNTNPSLTSNQYPDWLKSWSSAISSQDLSQLASLPAPPSYLLSNPHIIDPSSIESALTQIISLYNDDKLGEAVDLLQSIRVKHHKLFNDHPNILELEHD